MFMSKIVMGEAALSVVLSSKAMAQIDAGEEGVPEASASRLCGGEGVPPVDARRCQ